MNIEKLLLFYHPLGLGFVEDFEHMHIPGSTQIPGWRLSQLLAQGT